MNNILPPNATRAEVAIANAITPELPVTVRDLWDPWQCPVAFLPYLAQSFSVDRWDANWSEQEKRAAIDAAFFVHKHKGTIAAVRRVVEPLGFLIDVIEWWEKSPQGPPHTFELIVGVLDKGITDEMYSQMVNLIYDAKPLRSHLTGLAIYAETRGSLYFGAATYCGDMTTVYPYEPGTVSVSGVYYHAGREHTIDSVSVYPR
ncbi:phage tail protein I [Photobacterium galatheae]|uniref:Tail protein n=1 Tax=Photobacterium galatheae TaxID=1654360 RepID=A0A066RUV8_9GAMM|nr:phage tail protein I [Photobacterium galatheae]KDM92901.1 tail protein [Photobacterium galatheae]MCM0148134.1 phage tail protein I [Photobacterium galatheae]